MHHQLQTLDRLIHFMDPELYKRLEETETVNLFFCFRWLLVWFKREFEWDDVIRLWEVLWTDSLSPHFLMFVALAVLDTHRHAILNDLHAFDEILKVRTKEIHTYGGGEGCIGDSPIDIRVYNSVHQRAIRHH